MPAASSTSASEPQPGAHRPASRRAVAIALALVAAALLAGDQLYGFAHDRMFARSSYNPAARVQHADAETVIIGASGAHYALDPAVLGGRSYNAASDGQSGFYVAALLNALPSGSIKRVIYGFDPEDVQSGLAGPNVKHLAQYAPWANHDAQFAGWIARDRPLTRFKLVSGFYRYRGLGPAVLRGYTRPRWDGNGFEPLRATMAPYPVPQPPVAPDLPLAESGRMMLQAIRAAVARHDAELVVLVTPMYGGNRGLRPQNAGATAAMRAAFAGLRVCDLTADPDPRLPGIYTNPAYYRDGAHTNATGAAAYSAIVRDMVSTRCFN